MPELYPPDRCGSLQDRLEPAGLDAVFITPSADLRYLTGYAATVLERLTCLVVPRSGEPFLVVPQLERPAAQASPAGRLGFPILPWAETDDPFAIVAQRLGDRPRRVAVGNRMWAQHALGLQGALPGVELTLADPVIRQLRMRKSAAEVEALRRAGAAIDRVHARCADFLRVGRTERAVGADIGAAIIEEGHASVDFIIVGSGPNAASPHHEVSDRVIERGDVVVVDIGGTTEEGYCSDSTRTYVVGADPEPDFVRYYEVLRRAQDAACAAVKPGVTAESVDAAARDIITEAGYGEQFFHRTGHGIGLESHEEPYIVSGNDEPIDPGMAFSIEPGIYFAGRHGARIEDIVVCTEAGVERMNDQPREAVVLPG
ncbi:MAG TPA: Xaa-Pro peptidase family protein [Mycobacteriales bacterium]|nr:Xaa-Pro peptidase family protein [Mycobacteriales bacterium]